MPNQLPARFVNPYTFVPWSSSQGANQARPTGHDGRNPRTYSGSVTVEWTLLTPLALPKNAESEGWLRDGKVHIPGSSVAGAVRSVHEAMFNGCFRVIDHDFIPGYREPAEPDDDLRLALVTKADNGEAREVRLCAETVWVNSRPLRHALPGELPTSGDILKIEGTSFRSSLNRLECSDLGRVTRVRRGDQPLTAAHVGDRVLLVSSTSVRRRYKRDRSQGNAFWATGELTDRVLRIDKDDDAAMLRAFRAAAAGTDDRRVAVNTNTPEDWNVKTTHVPVQWWANERDRDMSTVARRARATGLLFPGDVVWVRTLGDRVTEIKLAAIWRRAGARTAIERLPEHLRPCTSAADLCLSCATFGMADTTDATQHRQSSYAGHVRFGTTTGTPPAPLIDVKLAPMGAPRPGNGMFYLQRYELDRNAREHDVANHWGSDSEAGRHQLAGRKFFWHADPAQQAKALSEALGREVPERYHATPKQKRARGDKESLARAAQLVPAGTKFTTTVVVDQLDDVAVHSLLAAIEPGRLLARARPGAQFALHLGGGKPLGLGSAATRITAISLHRLSDRYACDTNNGWQETAFPGAAVQQRVGPFTKSLSALARVLDVHGLGENAHLVSYPPGSDWADYRSDRAAPRRGETMGDLFTESFRFFGEASGEKLARGSKPWAPLPHPMDDDPTLPIHPKDS